MVHKKMEWDIYRILDYFRSGEHWNRSVDKRYTGMVRVSVDSDICCFVDDFFLCGDTYLMWNGIGRSQKLKIYHYFRCSDSRRENNRGAEEKA